MVVQALATNQSPKLGEYCELIASNLVLVVLGQNTLTIPLFECLHHPTPNIPSIYCTHENMNLITCVDFKVRVSIKDEGDSKFETSL